MAKRSTLTQQLVTDTSTQTPLGEVMLHYDMWTEDGDTRRNRENGWNDVLDAYWGRLPDNWPYLSRVVDPRLRTTLFEKKSRLTNSKLRGRLVPREGGDVLKARLNNAVLDFQWDAANDGGTMNSKWGTMDLDTRLYGSCFGLTKWKYVCVKDEDEKDEKEVLFNGNEFSPLDINNVGLDPNCQQVRNARWAQVREWTTIEDLETINDESSVEPMFPGLSALKAKISMDKTKGENWKTYRQDRRDTAYQSRVHQLKGIRDRMGEDYSFPVYEIVTEYRPDRWITFSPKYKIILRDIPNPYEHHRIPLVQLRYYPLSDDPMGESEAEIVLPLWRAIQATLCGFLDTMNMHMRPPIKVIGDMVRIETIVWGPEAQWDVDQMNAVEEMQGSGEGLKYFQTTYSALITAFNTAMGDSSQGTGSSVDPFNPQKTATEIKNTAKQQTVRDQNNQIYLAEAIEDMMFMWVANNKQFLFADPDMYEYVVRIVGHDMFNYFKRAGLHDMTIDDSTMQMIGDIISEQGGNVNDEDINALMSAGESPRFPVFENPQEKNPAKLLVKPKMKINEMGDGAELSIIPDDLVGNYDYIADVKSMSVGAADEALENQNKALQMITGSPAVLQLLTQEGIRPNVKELLVTILNNSGLSDAERYFEQSANGAAPAGAGAPQTLGQPGLQGAPSAMAGGEMSQLMGGPANMPPAGAGQLPPSLSAGAGQGAGF